MKRAGVSPVIATLLLIVIAVAAAVLAYIWIIGYQGTLTQQASTAQLQERIKIEAVEYTGTSLKVYVRNIGDVKVNISAVYVYDPSGTVLAKSILTPSQYSIDPGKVTDTTTSPTVSVTLTSGTTYTVKVVTVKGTEATYTFTYRT
jgi:flagellin-like protein